MRGPDLVLLALLCACSSSLIPPIATVRVIDASNNQPICDATVFVDDTAAMPEKANGSNPCSYNGRYTGSSQSIDVRVSKAGYYDVKLTTTTTTPTVVLDPVK